MFRTTPTDESDVTGKLCVLSGPHGGNDECE